LSKSDEPSDDDDANSDQFGGGEEHLHVGGPRRVVGVDDAQRHCTGKHSLIRKRSNRNNSGYFRAFGKTVF